MALSIVNLARDPLAPGDARYYHPAVTDARDGDDGWAIILRGLTPDRLTETDPAVQYGTLQIMTSYGVRTVTSLDVGVLVIEDC
jgi:hypothetical protein